MVLLLRIQNVGVGIKALQAVLKGLRMGFRVLKNWATRLGFFNE